MTLLGDVRDAGVKRIAAKPTLRFLVDLFGYGLASVAALAADYGLLVALCSAGLNYLVSAMLSFSAGMVVAYVLSVRVVFADRRTQTPRVEAIRFVAIGIAGLALTQALLFVFVARLGWAVAAAKLPTTGIVFAFNFLCRRSLVFSGSP